MVVRLAFIGTGVKVPDSTVTGEKRFARPQGATEDIDDVIFLLEDKHWERKLSPNSTAIGQLKTLFPLHRVGKYE